MNNNVLTRKLLHEHGLSDWQVDRYLRLPGIAKVGPGLWVLESLDAEEHWRATLAANTTRSVSGGVASHRSAAKLHRFDGNWAYPTDMLVPLNSVRQPGVFRTKTLLQHDLTSIDGVSCTSIARTLIDLGRLVDADAVEMALESALRGADHRQPEVWNSDLLQDLDQRAVTPRILGHAVLRQVLRCRPSEARPTGSGAETRLLQALRRRGLDREIERQPCVTLIDHTTGARLTAFPDFLFASCGLAVEVDGVSEHSGFDRRTRDDHRENRLSSGLRVLRFTGTEIWRRANQIAEEIDIEYRGAIARGQRSDTTWANPSLWTHVYEVHPRRRG
jgi:very-short-patch-repair endonuclease